MPESLLPHMNTFYKQNTIFNLEGKIRELDRTRTTINSDDIDYKIEQINKEHGKLLEELEIEELDQIVNPNNPSFGIITSQETIDDIVSRRGKNRLGDVGSWLAEDPEEVIADTSGKYSEIDKEQARKMLDGFEFGMHISKHHGGDQEITQTCEDCGMVFSGDPFLINEQSMDHVMETGHTTFRVDKIGDTKYHESLELPLEPMGVLLISKTREWWDVQDYDSKLEFLSERFRQAGELAKARWIHLPSQVKDSILGWVDRNSLTEKFKSRKQQQWYHATDQTFYDDEPHENRKVEGESKANEYEHSDEEVSEIGYLDGKNDMKYNATQFMTDKIGDSRKMRIYNSGYHKGKAEQSFEAKAEEDYDTATGKEDRGDFTMSIASGKHLAECKHCGQTWILSAYEEAETLVLLHLRMKHGITESKADDIDWTEDKPDETPFYCPMCAMVIEETATYDGVFDHNKQVHGMSDEDAETLAKGFTYTDSPPTSEESRSSEWYNPTEWESRIMRRKEKEQRLKSMGLAEITDEYNDPESAVIVRDDYAKAYNENPNNSTKTSEGVYDPFIDQKSLDQWKRLSSYASPILKTSYKKGDYSLDRV